MKNQITDKSSFFTLNATRIIVTTIGVILGFSGFNHGFFEFLQGNTPTNGPVIQAIGEAQRFWSLGTEEALTIIPNFLISGILSMVVGLTIVVWSLWFIQTKHGRTVFLVLFIILFLVGGGIAQIVFFIPAWAFATRMDKPLTWWKKVLPRGAWPFLSKLWPVTLAFSTIAVLIGLEMAIFGYFPGISNPQDIQNIALLLVLVSAILNIVSFIAGFGHDLLRMNRETRLPINQNGNAKPGWPRDSRHPHQYCDFGGSFCIAMARYRMRLHAPRQRRGCARLGVTWVRPPLRGAEAFPVIVF